ncbi:MAG: pyruvate kinase [Porticoccaceae bacterium]|jgi:pyruvate kinase|nr:pyruvate kinase [Porticoccaceae bacterium]MBT7375663.1 pyruvate kinase [Porticoccaceae bacterium]
MPRRTKILATLGPGSSHDEGIRELIVAGVNVFRLNFSHGSAEEHTQRAQTIRSISQALKTPVGILCDMQGPKIRIGSFTDDKKVDLVEGGSFTLDSEMDPEMGDENAVFIAAELLEDIEQNDTLLLDDGRLTLQVRAKTAHAVNCVVIQGGILSSKKGVNKFGGGLSAKALTEKDKADIKTAAALNTDYLAISFVQSSEDVEETRQLLTAAGSSAHIIAKVERAEAITPEFLPGIIESADGVMVARGDLGVEIGDANLVAVQKQLIEAASAANKVVITATQMMESMISAPTPTRAEVFDVANAVLDGTDAVMLSAETAVGKYPVETVKAMARVIEGAEKHPLAQRSKHRLDETFQRIDESLALSAMYVANHLQGVKAVICMTETGFTPLLMSRITSSLPIYAMAEKLGTCEITALYKGVVPVPFDTSQLDPSEVNHLAVEKLREYGAVTHGDLVLITKGDFVNVHGGTNTLKIVRVGDVIR